MKLSSSDIANLITLLNTASLCGIDAVIISEGLARGVSPAKTSVLLSANNLPSVPNICIGRVKELQGRLSLFASNKEMVVQAKESDRNEIVSLEISAGRNKAQYRCASVLFMNEKIPRKVPDADIPLYSLTLTKDEIKTVIDAVRVMGSKNVALIVKPDGTASFDAMDSSNDHFNVAIESTATKLDDDADETLVNYFSVEVLNPVLKELMNSDNIVLSIASKTLSVQINEHRITMLPQIIEGDDE